MAINVSEVNVKYYGAKGDGTSDDTLAIQNAIDSTNGGVIFFPLGVYKISAPLVIKRGITLRGVGTFDDIAGSSSKIVLADNSNCSMIKTPAAVGGSATHYMALENLVFFGNKFNQTTENPMVMFWGAWVGSWIRSCAFFDNYGPALSFGGGGCDVELSHIWVSGTDTTGYAVEFNPGTSGSWRDGIMGMHDIYIERTTNGMKAADPTDRTKYGKSIHANRLVRLSITEIHFEHTLIGMDIDKCMSIHIGTASSAHMGDPARESALFRFLGSDSSVVKVETAESINCSSNFNMVMPASGVSSNEIMTIPAGAGNGFLANYGYSEQDGRTGYFLPQSTRVLNQLKLVRNGGWDGQRFILQVDESDENKYHYLKGASERVDIGTRYGKSSEKYLISCRSGEGADPGDAVFLGGTLYVDNRTDAAYVENGGIFNIQNVPVVGKGSNLFERISTVRLGTGAPTANAQFVGQIYVDTSNKNGYLSVNVGSGASDWKKITP
ncbi:hypothetical protein B1A99_03205 [Cohnella sp. CIP 111063]|uniref:glycosyl hydrolase family 28-related protein n=1 Tax=unclassified Cohnella TaxID=2636738 RepID=UPI000B8C1DF7|nr:MULTISPECIES: glycosyl hydrolase family 28-related protein [unclassified Cohnella]OXS61639.1 hypothetical protein B1A99_03205 [Cohnella sp. CIP 111063]PRX74057.1 pectate lyase-like protein [Cohnella sp. SGD-V74]